MLDGRFDPAFALVLDPDELDHLEELTRPYLLVSLAGSLAAIAGLAALYLIGPA